MEFALVALNHTLAYMLLLLIGILLFVAGGIFWLWKGGGTEVAFLTLGFVCVFLYFIFSLFVPFITDYSQKEIITVEGVYNNADIINGRSSAIGIHTVTLSTDSEIISLSTVPGKDKVFVAGEYHVVAYYAPNSKILLHIEIIEEVASQ